MAARPVESRHLSSVRISKQFFPSPTSSAPSSFSASSQAVVQASPLLTTRDSTSNTPSWDSSTALLSSHSATSSSTRADELFYKGQLLQLQLSSCISMVLTLLLSTASTSFASDSTSTSNSSRESNGSTSSFFTDCAALLLPDSAASSSRPSSATEDNRHLNPLPTSASFVGLPPANKRSEKQYLSSFATRFSSVFHRGGAPPTPKKSSKSLAKEVSHSRGEQRRACTTAREEAENGDGAEEVGEGKNLL